MPYFFFTDPTMIAPQAANEAYGFTDTTITGNKTFLVTSIHKSVAGGDAANTNYLLNPPAIAVTSGRICVIGGSMQATLSSSPNYDNELVTIVLKPDDQPGGNIPNVKYYVYKGVLLKSLLQPKLGPGLSDPGTLGYFRYLLNTANAAQIPFIGRIQASFNQLQTSGRIIGTAELDDRYIGIMDINGDFTNDPPKRKVPNAYTPPPLGAGTPLNFFTQQTLDDIFNANWNIITTLPGNTGTVAELPHVNAGEVIGFFRDKNHEVGIEDDHISKGTFGFEVILDGPQNLGYELIPEAIAASGGNKKFKITSDPVMKMIIGSKYDEPDDNIYNPIFRKVIAPPTPVGAGHKFESRLKRLEILNYMDPCAFYGAFANRGMITLNYIVGGVQLSIPSGGGVLQTTINNTLYQTILSPFNNRNKIYLDIRDRFNNPYNIFRDKSYFADTPDREDNLRIFFNDTTAPLDIDYYGNEGTGTPFTIVRDWPILVVDLASNNGGVGFPIIPLPTSPAIPGSVNINLGFSAIPSVFGSASVSVLNYNFNLDFNAPLLTDQNITPLNIRPNFSGFVKLPPQISSYTDDLRLLTPVYTGIGVTDITPICNYIRMWHIYHNNNFKTCETLGTYFDEANLNTVGSNMRTNPSKTGYMADYPIPLEHQPNNHWDFLFPLEAGVNWPMWGGTNIRNRIYSDGVYIDNSRCSGRDFIGSIGIARDSFVISTAGFVPQTSFCVIEQDPPVLIANEIDRSFQNISMVTPPAAVNTSSYMEWLGNPVNDNILVNSTSVMGRQLYYLTYRPINSTTYQQVQSFHHISMDTVDYDAAVQNFTTVYEDDLSNGKIPKAYWSFKPITTGFDGNSSKTFVQYRVFIKYFFHGTDLDPTTIEHTELKEYDTGFSAFQLLDDTDTSRLNIPGVSEGNGFSIENHISGGIPFKKIRTTIYLAKGAGLTYSEFLSYRIYFENNIKSVWTTSGVPDITNPLDFNSGFLAPLSGGPPIDIVSAHDIVIKEATAEQFRGLKDNEILFVVDRSKYLNVTNWSAALGAVPNVSSDRSAVSTAISPIYDISGNIINYNQYARTGRMVYNSPVPPGSVGIADDPDAVLPCPVLSVYQGDNAPAHEFGHAMGLADRYTFATQINGNNEIIANTDVSTPMYLPATYDAEYEGRFRWVNNLMGSQGKIPNPGAALYPGEYSADLPPIFTTRISGYESSNNSPLTDGRGNNFFISPTQWNVINNYSTDFRMFESNPVTNPVFIYQNVVHFMRTPPTKVKIFFFGYDPVTTQTYSDFQYGGTAENMNARGSSPSNLFGFAGPLTLMDGSPSSNINASLSDEAAERPELAIDLKIGNNIPVILPNIPLAGTSLDYPSEIDAPFVNLNPLDPREIFPFTFNAGNANAYFGMNLTTFNSVNFAVDPAQNGRVVWNRISSPAPDTVESIPYMSTTAGSLIRQNIHYMTSYINRLQIIQIIVFGGG